MEVCGFWFDAPNAGICKFMQGKPWVPRLLRTQSSADGRVLPEGNISIKEREAEVGNLFILFLEAGASDMSHAGAAPTLSAIMKWMASSASSAT